MKFTQAALILSYSHASLRGTTTRHRGCVGYTRQAGDGCLPCPRGYYAQDHTCLPCDKALYDGLGAFAVYPDAMNNQGLPYCRDPDDLLCPPGTYENQDKCLACPVGTYSDRDGWTECKPCDPFLYEGTGAQSVLEDQINNFGIPFCDEPIKVEETTPESSPEPTREPTQAHTMMDIPVETAAPTISTQEPTTEPTGAPVVPPSEEVPETEAPEEEELVEKSQMVATSKPSPTTQAPVGHSIDSKAPTTLETKEPTMEESESETIVNPMVSPEEPATRAPVTHAQEDTTSEGILVSAVILFWLLTL